MARRPLADMRRTIQRRVGFHSQATDAIATGLLADVHREIAVQTHWAERKREALLTTVAQDSTGTVAVTNGSAAVVGTGTAWTAAHVGRAIAIQAETSFFRVGAVADPTHLTLVDAQGVTVLWPGPTATGQTFRIFQHQYALPPDVAVILSQIRDFPLRERTVYEFDLRDPQRTSSGEPVEFAMARTTITGVQPFERVFVEFWPVPAAVRTYRMPYLIEPGTLKEDDDLPNCPSEPVEIRATAELAWFLYAKTGDPRWQTLGTAFWQAYMGTPGVQGLPGVMGVLEAAQRDNEQRFGLPKTIRGDGDMVGDDFWASHDVAAMG